MAGNHTQPHSLSEAIERLERATQNKSQEFRDMLGKDYSELRKAIDDLKPYMTELTERVSGQVNSAKANVESKMTESPWTTFAVVGLVGLFLGWIFGFSSRRGD